LTASALRQEPQDADVGRIRRLLTVPAAADDWGASFWRGRLLLHTFSFAATAIAIAAVGSASRELPFHSLLIALAALGHVVSNIPMKRRLRLSVVIYPALLVAAFAMRADLIATFPGGSLLPFARMLAVVLAVSSFSMRSLRSLYDLLLLGLIAILLASEGALSHEFGLFLLMFGAAALGFLALAYPVGEALRVRWVPSGARFELAVPVVGVVVVTMAVSVAAFLAFPQAKVSLDAKPLPSRLDLTSGRPVAPSQLPGADRAPWAQFLPSQDDSRSAEPDPSVEAARTAADPSAGASGGAGASQAPSSDPARPRRRVARLRRVAARPPHRGARRQGEATPR
jgi:hypothetical protein